LESGEEVVLGAARAVGRVRDARVRRRVLRDGMVSVDGGARWWL
jgi:hypothetical protein